MQKRTYDLILWGATGYTGKLVAEYLFTTYGVNETLRWAIAGRNAEKLAQVKQDLGADELEVILADSFDMDALNKMCQQARVICSTVGPYTKYGGLLVEACVDNQTDYCDLTGEVVWMRKMIDQHHTKAQENGTRIVRSCGFDSIPSDLGVFFLQQAALKHKGQYCHQVSMRVKAAKGGLSGGTYDSMSNTLKLATEDASIIKTLFNPYALNPKEMQQGADDKDLRTSKFDANFNAWIAPFIMATINTRVVRRSHALQDFMYGEDFKYDEAVLTGKGLNGRLKANAVLLGTGLLMTSKPGSLPRKLIDRYFPKPGGGPTKEQREQGFFKMEMLGLFQDDSTIMGSITGDHDPGYGSTSKMLGESAVCLALDKEKTPNVSGMLTPATAFGAVLIDRLQANAGLAFKIYE